MTDEENHNSVCRICTVSLPASANCIYCGNYIKPSNRPICPEHVRLLMSELIRIMGES